MLRFLFDEDDWDSLKRCFDFRCYCRINFKDLGKEFNRFLDRLKDGYDVTDLWDLKIYLAKIILIPLKEFREVAEDYPSNLSGNKEWKEILDKMIFAFAFYASGETLEFAKSKKYEEVQEGLKLFAEYFVDLWC